MYVLPDNGLSIYKISGKDLSSIYLSELITALVVELN